MSEFVGADGKKLPSFRPGNRLTQGTVQAVNALSNPDRSATIALAAHEIIFSHGIGVDNTLRRVKTGPNDPGSLKPVSIEFVSVDAAAPALNALAEAFPDIDQIKLIGRIRKRNTTGKDISYQDNYSPDKGTYDDNSVVEQLTLLEYISNSIIDRNREWDTSVPGEQRIVRRSQPGTRDTQVEVRQLSSSQRVGVLAAMQRGRSQQGSFR
jgi:hypothetical protein